ncbi:MAG TPA: DUF6788 family protein [Pyrinomonadaceae bacterium]|nr:DUF6788 family protein [Pyrinomonadaceae bacterium]
MRERQNLSRLSVLALCKRREGLSKNLPPLAEILRGSLMERYMTCGKADCRCARGERHGPIWYLSVTLDQSHRAGGTVPPDQVEAVRRWIENDHIVKDHLEKISDINRELLQRNKSARKNKTKAKR